MITVRIPDDLKDRIDAARPATTSREAWVRDACRAMLAMGGYTASGLEAGPTPVPRPADQGSQPGSPPPAPASPVVPSAPLRVHEPNCFACADRNRVAAPEQPSGDGPCPEMCATCTRNGPPRTRACAKCGHKA